MVFYLKWVELAECDNNPLWMRQSTQPPTDRPTERPTHKLKSCKIVLEFCMCLYECILRLLKTENARVALSFWTENFIV